MSDPYSITVLSLPDYEDLVAEVYIGGEFVCLVSQEVSPDLPLVEISSGDRLLKIELRIFEEALGKARERLFQLRRRSKRDG